MSYNETERGIQARKSIYDVYEIKRQIIEEHKKMNQADEALNKLFESINGHAFHRISVNESAHNDPEREKLIDQRCWKYMINLYQLQKYMLCTEYEKMSKQINDYDFPPFTIENAETWLLSLKAVIYENVQKLIEDVYERITQETYRTGGSGWNNSIKKKRNNNGIDKMFIISTGDNYSLEWYSNRPTITDDLEKACYIIDGKSLPDVTIKNLMYRGKIWESENEYFKIRVCKNGNTHYWMNDKIRDRLNIYGSKRGVIGEDIKIKIFEKE